MEKQFYWEIVLRDGESLYVTLQQAGKIGAALKNRQPHIEINGSLVAATDIKRLRQSDRVVSDEDERNLIESGQIDVRGREPLVNPATGGVMWRWVKKVVSKRKYETFYAVSPGYYKLGNYYGGESIWVAFRKPLISGESMSTDLEICTEAETKKLPKDGIDY